MISQRPSSEKVFLSNVLMMRSDSRIAERSGIVALGTALDMPVPVRKSMSKVTAQDSRILEVTVSEFVLFII